MLRQQTILVDLPNIPYDQSPAEKGKADSKIIQGYAWPGTLTVASDSHTNMYGGIYLSCWIPELKTSF